jgi:hypothetical protein
MFCNEGENIKMQMEAKKVNFLNDLASVQSGQKKNDTQTGRNKGRQADR